MVKEAMYYRENTRSSMQAFRLLVYSLSYFIVAGFSLDIRTIPQFRYIKRILHGGTNISSLSSSGEIISRVSATNEWNLFFREKINFIYSHHRVVFFLLHRLSVMKIKKIDEKHRKNKGMMSAISCHRMFRRSIAKGTEKCTSSHFKTRNPVGLQHSNFH